MKFDSVDWSGRHQMMGVATSVDQVEKNAIMMATAAISAGFEDEKAVGVFDDEISQYGGQGEEDWEKTEEIVENAEGDALSEIEYRAEMLGDYYPFELNGAGLRYKPSKTGVYEFCLAASLAKALSAKRNKAITTHFELLAADVAKYYLGSGADVVRTGWPSHNKAERPVRFKALFEIVASRAGEWHWSPKLPYPDDPHHRQVKDEGVDFVAWKPMPDKRPGKLFVLGQCACGNDWDEKLAELNVEKLERWFRPPTAAEFQRAFALPRTVTGRYIFAELSNLAGLVFDRARIVAIAEANGGDFSKWRAQLDPLTELIIPSPNGAVAVAAV